MLTKGIYYVEAHDKRAVFIMPWRGNTLVGTTESPYQGDPVDVRPLPHEEVYLMNTLLRYFPKYNSMQKILSSTAGLRVLPSNESQNSSGGVGSINSRSRETILHTESQDNLSLLTIYGGKVTTYRLTAERVMARVSKILPVRKVIADTRHLKL
jgi:glycerol-3-phosphate dehydrogenase